MYLDIHKKKKKIILIANELLIRMIMNEKHVLKQVVVCFPDEIAFDLYHEQRHCTAMPF